MSTVVQVLPTEGFPTDKVPTAGLPTDEVPTAGSPTAGDDDEEDQDEVQDSSGTAGVG